VGGAVELEGAAHLLVVGGDVRRWSAGGYGPRRPLGGETLRVLTPPSIVRALAAGYTPRLHPTATAH
jgi:hypothetical protein